MILSLLLGLACWGWVEQRPALTTVMYMVDRPAAIASFQKNWRSISIIAPQSFTMDAEGFISGDVPPVVLQTAREHGVALLPLVTNRGFNQTLMHTLLDTPASRARAIRYLLYYALRDGYIGFQFDYENIKYLYRDRFSLFFHESAVEFHKHGLLLSAAVVGKYTDDRNTETAGGYDDWSGVYDYPRLARDADFLSIMAYPQHAGFSGPGPLAGLPWVRRIVDFTRANVPARKISLGIPLYGFHWVAGSTGGTPKWKGRTSLYPATAEVIAKNPPEWREDESAYRTVFDDDNGRHELWYEDARSIAPKLDLAASQGLAGISGWALGQEDPAMWERLARDYSIRHPRVRAIKGSLEARSKAAAQKIGRSGRE